VTFDNFGYPFWFTFSHKDVFLLLLIGVPVFDNEIISEMRRAQSFRYLRLLLFIITVM
jgi:hypothetical protein